MYYSKVRLQLNIDIKKYEFDNINKDINISNSKITKI